MRQFSVTPVEMILGLWHHRGLIKASANREVLGRYRGSVLGVLWSFFNPLIMLSVYTFVFSVVFKARWSSGSSSKSEFALILFAGLIVFNLFSECINRAPSLITSNVNYVKKVLFPLEVLPCVILISAMFHGLISLVVWICAYSLLFGLPHITIIYFPLVIIPFLMFIIGISWALASLGVYLRDVSQFISIITTLLMFLSPIFYPAKALPESYQHLLYLNPLTPVIELTRDVLFWGNYPDFSTLGLYWAVSLLIAWIGYFLFQKTRKGFADVL